MRLLLPVYNCEARRKSTVLHTSNVISLHLLAMNITDMLAGHI